MARTLRSRLVLELIGVSELDRYGVVLLRNCFAAQPLMLLQSAAPKCFHAIESQPSVLVSALHDFGCPDPLEVLKAPGLQELLNHQMGAPVTCNLDQSWVRKKHAPGGALRHSWPHTWHQDGALGVKFPSEPGPMPGMTRLITCWLPLTPAGGTYPGLEFVRRYLDTLLHFTELDDTALRRRFPPEDFWAPVLEPGDALIFLNGTLHRTWVDDTMRGDRLSVEYRFC